MAIRIVLVDDHPLVVKGLEQLLQSSPDFEVLDDVQHRVGRAPGRRDVEARRVGP